MKKVGVLLVVFHFLYIFCFCLSVYPIIGVLSDSKDAEQSTLDIQPTVLSNNISNNADPEASINPSEEISVPNNEAHPDSLIDSVSTNVLDHVPEAVFSEVGSELTGVANEVINNDTPIVISRIDSATEELQKRANIASSLSNEDNVTDNIEATGTNITSPVTEIEDDRSDINTTTLETEEKTMPKNVTDKNAEDIPSFSEWAQKHLEEAEKKEQINFSTPNPTINTTKQYSGGKLRGKNYASVDCGAKVVVANSEAQHSWAILMGSKDEYILNPCNSRSWFIVELCEAIQLKKVDLANYELFSSSTKDFTVSVSDRFPTRDWFVVGQFTAKDERDLQSFDVNTETFGKYVKVEIKSHYGSEHFCTLSLFRAYGMSVFEVLQKDDPAHEQTIEDDDDDDDPLDNSSKADSSGNLLSSATDAVLSMVKKAAQVLGNKVNKTNESSQISNEAKPHSAIIKSCSSPSHYVVCNNCSDMLFGEIFELLSCSQNQITNLVSIPFLSKALVNSMICHRFGFDFKDKTAHKTTHSGSASVESFFPPKFLGAMCNALAIIHNKVIYNVSHQYANTTENIPSNNVVDVETNKPKIMPIIDGNSKEVIEEIAHHQPTEPLNSEVLSTNSKASCSTDDTYTSQINPSKSSATDQPIHSETNTATVAAEQVDQLLEQEKVSDVPPVEPTVLDTSAENTTEPDLPNENNIEENVDKLMTELNTEASPSIINTPTAPNHLQGQKESVFLRLSNRIKSLERNMSLSSQYLEELSKRYKKQVEEMQRVLEKTEQTLNEVTTKQEERHKQLEDRLESLTKAMETLLADRQSWKITSYWSFFVILSIFLIYCFNKYSSKEPAGSPATKPVEIQRRNSVGVVTRVTPKKKKRRPSDQALKIVATAASGDQEKLPKKRKKKTSNPSDVFSFSNGEDLFSPPCTSSKIWSKPSNADWVEGRGRVVENIPFALEESDSSTLETLPLASEISSIDAPSYAKTAATFRLGRSISLRNGKIKNLDEVKNRQPSPVSSANGSISSTNEQTPKKERKGFRKLFKKVF